MSTTTEPAIWRRNRMICADWLVKTTVDEDGREKRHIACLTVSYDQGGMSYFSGRRTPRSYTASIGRETEEGSMRGYMMFSAKGFLRSEPVARFSAKQQEAFFERALAELERRREEPEIAQFFDPAQ